MENVKQLEASKREVCSHEIVMAKVREFIDKKKFAEIRIRIHAGKIKEATYSESEHFDN